MYKPILFCLFFLLLSCNSKIEHKEVLINKTIKVYSEEYHDKAENYTFKWQPPRDINNQSMPFNLKNDILIFTPTIEGDYQVHLSITDISNEVVAEEIFYYRVIPDTITKLKNDSLSNFTTVKSSIRKPKESNKSKIKSKGNKNKLQKKYKATSDKKNNYTIQVASWPLLEQARSDQIKLIEEGIEAYIQRYYDKEKDEVWYRVRVGNFTSKHKADQIKKVVELITEKPSWIDVILSE